MITELKLNSSNDAIQAASEIISDDCKNLRSVLYKDIVLNALKCKRDELDILDLKVLNRAISEFRHAARMFKPHRNTRKISIFGSARTTPESPEYKMASDFGELAARDGYMVITGGSSGIMRAGIEGAGAENSFGVKILLPHEKETPRVIQDDPKLMTFKYFFIRKLFFVMEANAVALFPGGFGTHDEAFEVLTLLQTGKTPPMPVVLLESPGENYWEMWDQFIRLQMLTRHLISQEDLSFYKIVHSPEEAKNWIRDYYSNYHSMRQVNNLLIIRTEKRLLEVHLRALSQKFTDLIVSGIISETYPLPEEADEPETLAKPRISFCYNKSNAGRLNQMILEINKIGRDY